MNPTRGLWLNQLERLVTPPLEAAAAGRLAATLPRAKVDRPSSHPLECMARILNGITPWLTLPGTCPEEAALQSRILDLVLHAFPRGCDPASSDFWGFGQDQQSLVDAAILAHSLLRAPALVDRLDSSTRAHLIDSLRSTRRLYPGRNNWLLFSACVEAALDALGDTADWMRVDYAIVQHEDWYCGDGWYSDGPVFHLDYYNSLIIHPMMRQILDHARGRNSYWDECLTRLRPRGQRLAEQLERLIAADGSWPPLGRSLAYRCGVFHHLADAALRRELPQSLPPASVRCALTAALTRSLNAAGTYTGDGWLEIGLAGNQPSIGENYITTASTYLCSHALLPLGLPESDPFWSDPDQPWTQVRIWERREDVPADHALSETSRSIHG